MGGYKNRSRNLPRDGSYTSSQERRDKEVIEVLGSYVYPSSSNSDQSPGAGNNQNPGAGNNQSPGAGNNQNHPYGDPTANSSGERRTNRRVSRILRLLCSSAESRSPRNSDKSGSWVTDRWESKSGTPKDKSPKSGSPKAGSPKAGSPKAGSPKAGSPKAGSPKARSPKAESPKAGSPKAGSLEPKEPITYSDSIYSRDKNGVSIKDISSKSSWWKPKSWKRKPKGSKHGRVWRMFHRSQTKSLRKEEQGVKSKWWKPKWWRSKDQTAEDPKAEEQHSGSDKGNIGAAQTDGANGSSTTVLGTNALRADAMMTDAMRYNWRKTKVTRVNGLRTDWLTRGPVTDAEIDQVMDEAKTGWKRPKRGRRDRTGSTEESYVTARG